MRYTCFGVVNTAVSRGPLVGVYSHRVCSSAGSSGPKYSSVRAANRHNESANMGHLQLFARKAVEVYPLEVAPTTPMTWRRELWRETTTQMTAGSCAIPRPRLGVARRRVLCGQAMWGSSALVGKRRVVSRSGSPSGNLQCAHRCRATVSR